MKWNPSYSFKEIVAEMVLSDMIYSIENNTKHRCNGDLALHVLDIIESTIKAAEKGEEISLHTTCNKPEPFTEEQIKLLLR